jgi:RHS repeat-associated protein
MGATHFWYDRAGNLTRQVGPGGVTGYRFDSRDRLVQVHTPSNQHVHYTYDAVGRMQTRRLGTETRPTRLEWDGWDLAREVAPNGLETTYHVPEGEIRSLQSGANLYQVYADALGNVRKFAGSLGSIDAEHDYDAWGNEILPMGPLNGRLSNAFIGAFGTRDDRETRLTYMRHRWYEPELGRFLTRDVVRSGNRYVYAGNSPVTLIDPEGLQEGPVRFTDPKATVDYLNRAADRAIGESGGGFWQTFNPRALGNRTLAVLIGMSGAVNAQQTGEVWGDPCAGAWERAWETGKLALVVAGYISGTKALFSPRGIPVYRAVTPDELRQILATRAYEVPSGLTGKYFFPTQAQAERLIAIFRSRGTASPPTAVTTGSVPHAVIDTSYTGHVAGEGTIYFIEAEHLPKITGVRVLP